jgi:hypothetical protein
LQKQNVFSRPSGAQALDARCRSAPNGTRCKLTDPRQYDVVSHTCPRVARWPTELGNRQDPAATERQELLLARHPSVPEASEIRAVNQGERVTATTESSNPLASCAPPYVVDATGKKHWKLECL